MGKIIDTHSHALPWVDHGSPDLETTLRMIREAAGAGTGTIVCTPHLYDLDEGLVTRAQDVHRQVAAAIEEEAIPVRLLLGFEVDLTVAAGCDLDTIRSLGIGANGGVGPLPSGTLAAEPPTPRAVLIEMPYSGWPIFLEQTVSRLVAADLLPILAHPERNERIQRSPEALAGALNAGAIAQGTAGSLSSMFRRHSQKSFHDLLERGWFGLLASDAHSQPQYTWSLGPLVEDLGKRLTPAVRELLTEVNPDRVLKGQSPIRPASAGPARKSWRRFA